MEDTDTFRLRAFVDGLVGSDEIAVIEGKLELCQVAAHLDGERRAVLMSTVGPEGAELVGNVMGSRNRLARALNCQPTEVLKETLRRTTDRLPPIEVSTINAPAHQVTLVGDEVDLTQLPVHLQHHRDGAPYISAAIDITRKATPGWFNVGCRRLMLRGPRETGIDLNAPSDLRLRYLEAAADGQATPIAFVVGSHPVDYMAAMTLAPPGDEMAIMGAMRQTSVPVVRCLTQDLLVPADAELVIEGYLDPAGYKYREGPYGEYLGYYGATKLNPVFHATALTRRSDALFQTATISGRYLGRTDTAQLAALATESGVWRSLALAVREPRAVYAHPAAGGMFNVRIALQSQFPGEPRNAIAAAFGSRADVKNVFVVDEDVDIFSDEQMEWALATRFQGDRDVIVGSGFRAVPLDPSLPSFRSPGSKAGFDLTRGSSSVGRDAEWEIPGPPILNDQPDSDLRSLEDVLRSGPHTFTELMVMLGDRDGRPLVRQLHGFVEAGQAVLQEDGAWAFVGP